MSDYNKRNTYQQLSPRSLMQTVLICPKCGEELQQGVARCNYCGYSLNNGTADSQPPVSPGFAGANASRGTNRETNSEKETILHQMRDAPDQSQCGSLSKVRQCI